VSVKDVQRHLIAGRVVSGIRRGLVADVAIALALTEPNDVMTIWGAEPGRAPEFVRWVGVRIAPEDAGLFRAWWRNAGSNLERFRPWKRCWREHGRQA
jgi:hypothetical protein